MRLAQDVAESGAWRGCVAENATKRDVSRTWLVANLAERNAWCRWLVEAPAKWMFRACGLQGSLQNVISCAVKLVFCTCGLQKTYAKRRFSRRRLAEIPPIAMFCARDFQETPQNTCTQPARAHPQATPPNLLKHEKASPMNP